MSAAKGKVRLVKVNVDENPEIAQQLRIQSLPTVYAFLDGQPVTGFPGAQPESQVKPLVERLLGETRGPTLAEARSSRRKAAAERGDTRHGAALFRGRAGRGPANPEALGGLARCYIADRAFDVARELLDQAPKEASGHAAITGAQAALQLADRGRVTSAIRPGSRRGSRPTRTTTRRATDLATVLFLRGQAEAAMEHLLQIVKRDRDLAGRPGAQAAGQVLRRARAQAPGDRQGPAQALGGAVHLMAEVSPRACRRGSRSSP